MTEKVVETAKLLFVLVYPYRVSFTVISNKILSTEDIYIYFKLLQLHFPKRHPLHSIFNRNTVKLSYSCSTNMDNILKAHNAKDTA